ncbi:MAG: hypothetical protein A3A94_03140 [Candidatus Portnoybacteria bacterium RIFCSPLOWO2_01_FULL_43_11]|uniref:Thioredoxin domain-containing protein n=3 Tax=Candidatus Portnoyibacteriota TaxID=1817913 RepID=A0A1G2FAI8_9BACT|nr:MAG: hypothetical protein A2815_02805 [Candidatus Portnoybacteria bacterium RIFCSPHIGHO2_01_FULL_40_12b]OGZ36863.1 MAG: hypothetical protein A3D38_01815 [Candidatus Portnoybacteria bacterium RIFCSPHIGHO2_02_FULL_40_23]OGZ38254.1 MAG: hypothetical protein A3A94_03140 [Candidatus Portnoybacteria bacterium RIFCSPLOWO2_01_FULL_43_11]OGZ39241.1 MAG: hypothetical protein A3E90_03085 [Candidatus Portnoybacteria bacterium RIFCSPHIGHO2_12_FULL_40_11]
MIAGAVIYTQSNNSSQLGSVSEQIAPKDSDKDEQPTADSITIKNVRPIDSKDHIRGNPDALVKIVEFSDTECPFCKSFHPTMQQMIEEYGKDGRVAWVYRHFPLVQIHPKAVKEAEATECANELGGNNKFWEYVDKIYEITPGNNQLDPKILPRIAKDIGLDEQKFNECLESGEYEELILNDVEDAINSGGRGTPFSIVIAPNGEKFELSGAKPYASVKAVIESALLEK